MSERDEILRLLDELARLLEGSPATSIEVETASFAVKVTRRAAATLPEAAAAAHEPDAVAASQKVQRVRATTVGIFSMSREWRKGDGVQGGTLLGGIQSLGHIADVAAPADGTIEEILVAAGAPVEYGQPLFAIAIA